MPITKHNYLPDENPILLVDEAVKTVYIKRWNSGALDNDKCWSLIHFLWSVYQAKLQGAHSSSVRKGKAYGIFQGLVDFTDYLIFGLGFVFGFILLHYTSDNNLTINRIIVVVLIFGEGIGCFNIFGTFQQAIAEAKGAAASVFQFLNQTSVTNAVARETWLNDDSKKSIIHGDIYFDHVNFAYPSRPEVPVLQDFIFLARAGETTAIVGSSGSGKSTCMSLLLRFYEPSSGQITINGQSISDYNVQDLRKNIGVVSQEPILFDANIYENIRYGNLSASYVEIEEAARQANAHNFIMRLPKQYNTLVGERGIQLSGGEKQRVALARTLVKQPWLLLLDEATSAIDSSSEKIVQQSLDKACQGRTAVVIAHRLTTIRNAHCIYVLDNGRVIEQGNHQTLMSHNGKYRAMVEAQRLKKTDDNNDKDQLVEDEREIRQHRQYFKDNQLNSEDEFDKKSSTLSNTYTVLMKLLAMNRPEWINVLVGSLAAMARGIIQPTVCVLIASIIGTFHYCTYAEQRQHITIFSCIYILLGFINLGVRVIQFTAFATSGSKLTQRMRMKAFSCYLRQEIAYFDRPENSCGALTSRLSSDAFAIQDMTGIKFGITIETIAMILFAIIFGSFFCWRLTLIAFLLIFSAIVIFFFDIHSTAKMTQATSHLTETANSLAIEAIQNIRTVKQLTIDQELLQQYQSHIHQAWIKRRNRTIISSLPYGIYWTLSTFIVAALYAEAVYLIERNQLSADNAIMVFAFVLFTVQSLELMMSMTIDISALVAAAKRYFSIYDRAPEIDNGSTKGQILTNFRGEIKFDEVAFAYPSRPSARILDKFNLLIKSGQRVAIVGTSGSGKSTIIQLLERFYDVNQGRLLLDGVDIRQLNIHWIRSTIGLVSQEPILFDLTIGENIAYGLENVSIEAIVEAATKANIHGFIEKLPQGYDTQVGSKGTQLSGGEKQRIAIARSLIRRPRILLLDEATSAMDSHNERIVQEALERSHMEDRTQTSITVAHQLSTIQSCDLIYVLMDEHFVESGTHNELMQQQGVYYQMCTHTI